MVGGRTKLYVGNLPESVTKDDLFDAFKKFGKVEECDVVKNYGFVHMYNESESKVAIEALNGSEFMGNRITVEASHSKVRPKPGMGGKGQCYRCGKSGHWSKECPRNSSHQNNQPAYRPQDRYNYNHAPPAPTHHSHPTASSQYNDNYYDSYGSRYGPMRYGHVERMDRAYGRPYIDPYERRATISSREDFYYRRPSGFDDYLYRRTPPPPMSSLPPLTGPLPPLPPAMHRMDRYAPSVPPLTSRYYDDRYSSYNSTSAQAQTSQLPAAPGSRREPVF